MDEYVTNKAIADNRKITVTTIFRIVDYSSAIFPVYDLHTAINKTAYS